MEARNKALTALDLCSLTLQVSNKYPNCAEYREKDFWPSDILNFTNMAGNKDIVLIEAERNCISSAWCKMLVREGGGKLGERPRARETFAHLARP